MNKPIRYVSWKTDTSEIIEGYSELGNTGQNKVPVLLEKTSHPSLLQ